MSGPQDTKRSDKKRISTLRIIAAIAVVQIFGSLAYPIAKVGLENIEPFTFAFYRFIIASVLLMSISFMQKYELPVERSDYLRILLLGFLIIPLNQTLFLVGQSMTSAGHGSVLFATTPVFIFILAIVHLKERPRMKRTAGIIMAVAGAMYIVLGSSIEIGREYFIGDIIIVFSVIAWAYYTIVGKSLVRKYGALRLTAYALTSGTIMYFPFGVYRAWQFDYSQTTIADWGSVVYMAVGLSFVVYVLWYWLLKHMEVSRIAAYHNIQPVVATAVSYYFLSEPLGWPFVIGGVVVIGGVLLAEL